MNKEKAVNYLEHSFLSYLLKDENITDISYNGENVYYVSSIDGRKKTDINLSNEEAKNFIRQIANLSEKQFSYLTPVLDVTIGRYRINAIHQSIARKNEDEVLTFSIRLASTIPHIYDGSGFLSKPLEWLLKEIIKKRNSIVIGGITGTGKTELQKYFISLFKENERVIVIDNVLELDSVNNNSLDLFTWQIDEKNINSSAENLIRNALRNNPDWLILAEARGKEMLDILNSSMTGLPIITTLHAKSASSMIYRMERMILMNKESGESTSVINDLNYHFHVFIYLCKTELEDGQIIRFVEEIIISNNNGEQFSIYSSKNNLKTYKKIPKTLLSLLNIDYDSYFLNWEKEIINEEK